MSFSGQMVKPGLHTLRTSYTRKGRLPTRITTYLGTHIVTCCMIAFVSRAASDSHGNEDQINIAGVQG